MPVPFTLKVPLRIRFESLGPESRWSEPNVSYTLFLPEGEVYKGSTRVLDSTVSQLATKRVYDCIGSVGVNSTTLGSCDLVVRSLVIAPSGLVIPL